MASKVQRLVVTEEMIYVESCKLFKTVINFKV